MASKREDALWRTPLALARTLFVQSPRILDGSSAEGSFGKTASNAALSATILCVRLFDENPDRR